MTKTLMLTRPSKHTNWIELGLLLSATLSMTGCLKPTLSLVPTSLSGRRSLAIPDVLPLGSVVRAHYHTQQTNGEAGDFVIYRREFVDNSATLTLDGKDHLVEIAQRMPQAPFPVIIERSENNSDPELDQHRRELVARILTDFGNSSAAWRTIVSPSYGPGRNSLEAEIDYYRTINSRGNGNNGTDGNNNSGRGGGGGGGYFGGGL